MKERGTKDIYLKEGIEFADGFTCCDVAGRKSSNEELAGSIHVIPFFDIAESTWLRRVSNPVSQQVEKHS